MDYTHRPTLKLNFGETGISLAFAGFFYESLFILLQNV